MFSYENFTNKAVVSIENAIKYAGGMGHTFIGSEHILYGIISEGTNVASVILKKNKITEKETDLFIRKNIGCGIPEELTSSDFTPHLNEILNNAVRISRDSGASLTGTEYILYSVLKNKSSGGYNLIKSVGADAEFIISECTKTMNGIKITMYSGLNEKRYPNICRYSKNFTKTASENGFDPVIGREAETERVIQILARKTKNNPCLVGEAGVGKTAIIEGLAQKIIRREVPDSLKNKHILSLDITAMLAGAKYRGDFEERLKNCIDEACSSKDIILFIDEIHNIAGAGAAEGAIDAANILKPELARGQIQIIGATTYSEYRKYIESDSALERRFQPVNIDEPDHEQLFRILRGIRKSYEKFHSVNISDDIINDAVALSERYITDRFLPDKAIDVLDEACSHAVIRNEQKMHLKNSEENIIEHLKKSISQEEILSSADESYSVDVMPDDVSAVISAWTGIPSGKINSDESILLNNLESEIKKHIIGQDKAVKMVSEAIRRCRTGLRDEKKPMGTFIFAGPTGVGKTELSKVIAETVFGSRNNMIRLDMSEYMEKHSVAKLIGAPPGYSGYGEETALSEMIRKKPYSIVLFDEIEKAHPDILNMLLQIADEGEFHDSQGRRINMKNTLIILTTNTGSEKIFRNNEIGFKTSNKNDNYAKEMRTSLTNHFKPELINRMDGIIVFEPLSEDSVKTIAELFLKELCKRAEKINIHIEYSDEVSSYISSDPETQRYGARPLKRIISEKIENEITKKIINRQIISGDCVQINVKNDEICIKKAAKKQLLQ